MKKRLFATILILVFVVSSFTASASQLTTKELEDGTTVTIVDTKNSTTNTTIQTEDPIVTTVTEEEPTSVIETADAFIVTNTSKITTTTTITSTTMTTTVIPKTDYIVDNSIEEPVDKNIINIKNNDEFQQVVKDIDTTELKTIILDSGVYKLTTDCIKDNLKITGSKDVIMEITSSVYIKEINNFTLDGIAIKVKNSVVGAIHITNSDFITITNCDFNGNYKNGASYNILASNSKNCVFSNSKIYGAKGKGIEIKGCSNTEIVDNEVFNTVRAGISVHSGNTDTLVKGNILYDNVNAFTVIDGAIDLYGTNNKNTTIIDNHVSDYGSSSKDAIGIRIKGSFNTICKNNTVIGNDTSYAFLYVQQRDGVIDDGVELSENKLIYEGNSKTSYGIRITEAKNILITKNEFSSTNGAQIYKLIELRNDVTNCTIVDNIKVNNVPYTIEVYLHPSASNLANINYKDAFVK